MVDTRYFILKSFTEENVRQCMEDVSADLYHLLQTRHPFYFFEVSLHIENNH
jgi:hypothetical protein